METYVLLSSSNDLPVSTHDEILFVANISGETSRRIWCVASRRRTCATRIKGRKINVLDDKNIGTMNVK